MSDTAKKSQKHGTGGQEMKTIVDFFNFAVCPCWFCSDTLICDGYCNHIISVDMHSLAANMILRGEY